MFSTDSGTAIPILNELEIHGAGGITTSGAGNTITITGSVGTETLTGNTGGPVSPLLSNINTIGSGSITVTGVPATHTLTAHLTGLTNHAVQVGAGTDTLTQVAGGSNGSVFLGATGADPAFATLTSSGGSVVFTLGPNSLNLETSATTPDSFVTNSGTATPALHVLSILGTTAAAGTSPLVTSGAGSTVTITAQRSQALAASDATKVGLSNFSSAQFAVDANGFVNLIGSGTPAILTINGDSGSITGSSVTIFANKAALNCGSTVSFSNTGTTSTFNVSDSNVNTIIGFFAGNAGISGGDNCGLGAGAFGALTTGANNIAIGVNALLKITSAGNNVAIGTACLSNLAGTNLNTGTNVAIGNNCMLGAIRGNSNSAFGHAALSGGSFQGDLIIAIGASAGSSYTSTENSNIVISNTGTISDTNTIRIGTQGSSSGQQNKCFIAGINGVATSNSQIVTIDSSTGQLGVVPLSVVTAWTDVTASTQTLAVSNGYATDNAGGVTYTLPSTAAFGDIISIVGKLGIAVITPNANQQILIGSVSGTVGVTGTATATNVGDCIQLRCITAGASTVWRAEGYVGTWTLA